MASVLESSVSPDALAAAAERRTSQLSVQPSTAQLAAAHEKRQVFRRLIDPGIIRPNTREQAIASLKTLLTISENLLREPENPKFRQFKPTNNSIKRNLVDPKGTLEYAIQLGFRPEVRDFQPYYSFDQRRTEDLRTGATILKEFIDVETGKEERAARSKREEKAAAEAVANQVKLAFMDDRKTKLLHDEREKEHLAARALARAHQITARETSQSPPQTPQRSSSGHLLDIDGPPPYDVTHHQ